MNVLNSVMLLSFLNLVNHGQQVADLCQCFKGDAAKVTDKIGRRVADIFQIQLGDHELANGGHQRFIVLA